MKAELEKQIIDIAPHMFIYKGSDNPQQSLICFGFQCDDGWFNLIKELVEKLKIIDIDKEIRVFQIKSKYAGLRFYIDHGINKIQNLISEYEIKSESVCEECGKDSKVRNSGYWLYTLCDKCWDDKKLIEEENEK